MASGCCSFSFGVADVSDVTPAIPSDQGEEEKSNQYNGLAKRGP